MDRKLGQPESKSALREMEKAHGPYSATGAKEASEAKDAGKKIPRAGSDGTSEQPGRRRGPSRGRG